MELAIFCYGGVFNRVSRKKCSLLGLRVILDMEAPCGIRIDCKLPVSTPSCHSVMSFCISSMERFDTIEEYIFASSAYSDILACSIWSGRSFSYSAKTNPDNTPPCGKPLRTSLNSDMLFSMQTL